MANGDNAQTIWNTLENMRRLDASLASFDDVLKAQLARRFHVKWIDLNQPYYHWTENDWACYAYWCAYKLRGTPHGARRRSYVGAATFKIELWRPADDHSTPWCHPKTPLIYVAFSPNHKDPWEEVGLDQYGNPLVVDDVRIDCPRQDSIWLWEWTGNNRQPLWRNRSWFFAVPLTAVNSHETVGAEIVDPLGALVLTELPAAEIFAERMAIHGADPEE